MADQGFEKKNMPARSADELRASVQYLMHHMASFVRKQERVLICFPDRGEGSIGSLVAQAVRGLGGEPMFWGPDNRWKTLLRQAFATRATAIVGTPLTVLGLSKLAKATGTPLFIESVMLTGYPSLDWMIDGIQRGLDCRIYGCLGVGDELQIGGFSCTHSRGVHLRDDVYAVEILDANGAPVEEGKVGEVIFRLKSDPEKRFSVRERARLETAPCACGCKAPRLMDISWGSDVDEDLAALGEQLHYWTSILDCRLIRTPFGVEMEIVTFFGQKLPKLPSCARQIVRCWDPENDCPFHFTPWQRKTDFSWENH